ncbi:unnamed protein product [Mytilus edulis]|uniref:B box-type domain-containing protein n=1 Tax=Mytilus edulis TaxID=6550 RepID=A0A8S3UFT8_MYTED|nr:unnamed protein product [Mytilus edulis]
MANSMKSSSIRKAQVPVTCYFCKGQEITWKCEDCNVRMCNSCKVTVHQGLQSAQDHDVVSVKDISKSSQSSQEVTSEIISSVFNSYTTTVPIVHTLLCSDDDLLYFNYCKKSSEDQFVKGKLLKSSIKILQTVNRSMYDVAIKSDGEILFTEIDVNKIQLLSPLGAVETVLDTFQMKPVAIHVNKDNEVIVGLREQGPPFPVHNFSVRQVLIFGNDYLRKNTLEVDRKGNKLFSYTFSIRTDSRNVVYVIDCLDDEDNGRVVAVDRNGRLRFIYNGQKELETFKPEGITVTQSDNIVVSDADNGALHVLNSKEIYLDCSSFARI